MAIADIIGYQQNTIGSLHTIHSAKQPVNFQLVGIVPTSQVQTYVSAAVMNLNQPGRLPHKMTHILQCFKDEPPFRWGKYNIWRALGQKHDLEQKLHKISIFEHWNIFNDSTLALVP